MPKIIGHSIGEHRERTREKLFQAMGDLLAELSYEQITLSMVAKRAGVGRTAIYNHFPDKDGLLFDFINENTTTFTADLDKTLGCLENPLDQLYTYIKYQLLLKERWNLVWRADIRALVSEQNRARFHEHALLVESRLCQILEDSVSQQLIPCQDIAALNKLVHSSIASLPIPRERDDRLATLLAVQNYILRGVGVPATYSPPAFNNDVDEVATSWLPPWNSTLESAPQPTYIPAVSRCPVHHS